MTSQKVWPRTICPHCHIELAVTPASGRITTHRCKCNECRPFNYLDIARDEVHESWSNYKLGPSCDHTPACGPCQEEFDSWMQREIRMRVENGFPCIMSGEPAGETF